VIDFYGDDTVIITPRIEVPANEYFYLNRRKVKRLVVVQSKQDVA
jgi:hypothetical protein